MKHSYLFLMTFLVFSFSQAQIVNIPDANFKDALVNTNCVDTDGDGFGDSDVDTNDDGEIQISEAETVLGLELLSRNISSMQGIEAFSNLEYLRCQGNNLEGLDVSSLTNLIELWCHANDLTSLNVNGLTNLLTLDCSENVLTSLDVSSLTNLVTLNCRVNPISTLDVSYLYSLVELNCSYNNLISLDVSGLANLTELFCSGNDISTLNVSGLTNLEKLSCGQNQLTSLNIDGLPNLELLDCQLNNLTTLDVSGLTNLVTFSCAENELTFLDLSNSINLNYINCSRNELTTLNVNGLTNLDVLNCEHNELTMLDVSSLTNLTSLDCDYNLLTTLDASNLININHLDCKGNQLITLFIKNNREEQLYIDENWDLEYVCVDDFELNYVQTYAQYVNPTCIVNSYCSFVPGGDYFTIQGENKLDLDVNGCNVNDPYYSNLKFNITDGSVTGTIISNSTGSYSIPVQAGIHTITPVFENPTYFSITPTSVVVDFPTDASPYNQDFCVVPNGVYNDLEITILPIEQAGPGFDANYKVTYKNKGTSTLSGNIYVAFQDDVMDFVVSNPANESGLSDLLSWSFNDLLPFESREIDFTMNLNAPTDSPPLNGDDVLEYIANISSSETDETPDDNTFIFNQTVVNSFDPNDKTCLEGQTITPEQVGKFVHYLIRFENTGTADAINIVVKDEIDLTKYDVASLIPLDGSHEFETRIKNDNVLEFIFEDINLPFDDANNDGYVLFKIKTLPSLVLGDEFSNDAEIYFDYNAPIITNDELTTVAENLSIEASELQTVVSIYPNPVSDYLNVKSKESLKQIAIYDIQGRQIKTIALTGNTTTTKVDMSSLSKGVYFVKIKTELGEQTSKIIKE
ncbi:T9SS type A sorting domain-containing protein [Xanthomarina gelatinilytica]|uniref:T9SS type A sorting domain-containing protein n=1 Tax=Xanthomarina gelatinilytica TaxID=1137281 RepID=UPI003AA8007C